MNDSMGTTASNHKSSNEKNHHHLKAQLTRIGDQNPFGDDDILRLSRCMVYLNASTSNSQHFKTYREQFDHENLTRRWLTDLAVFCSTLPPADDTAGYGDGGSYHDLLQLDPNLFHPVSEEVRERRRRIKNIMTIIEEHVLPPNFGETLHERLFALLTPSISMDEYDRDSPVEAQSKIAWKRLEKFIEGVSDTSRRGSRRVLTSIFKCCTKDAKCDEADAKEVLDCAYRLSLACAIYSRYMASLEEEDDMENEQDEQEQKDTSIPNFDPSTLFPQDIGDYMVGSLLEHAEKENNLSGRASMLSADGNVKIENNIDKSRNISLGAFLSWAETSAPCLSSCLETFMHQVLFPDKPYPPSRSEFTFPDLRKQHSAFFVQDSSPLLFSFAVMSLSLGGAWHRLYTSDSDGLSFNRLQNSLLGYSGPTLLIMKEAEHGGIFGAKTSTAWKESKNFYGDSDCFLFSIKPRMKLMRPLGTGTNYMYCNSVSRSRGYDGLAHGIGFGGNSDKPRLFIPETFDHCLAGSSDLTFEPGQLLPSRGDGNPSKVFDLESLEVWGVGGDAVVAEALGNRHKQREIVASNIRKARKVDKAQFLDDLRSGLIESKAFKHRDEIRGRGDCHIDDKDENNYICE